MARESWTSEENAATVAAYLDMLEQELTGQPFVKSEINRRLVERIGRTRGAVERKFQNVSAVLRDERCIFVDGYKPLGNYQQALADEVRTQLRSRRDIFGFMDAAVDAPAATRLDFSWNVTDPPLDAQIQLGPHSLPEHGFHTDYVAREAENRQLGHAGEVAVLELERGRLRDAGRNDLADRVRHVSEEDGDGLGYDILSFDASGERRLIEVKTTRRSIHWPMVVSRNEIRVSERRADEYVLARVFAFASMKVGLYELPGAVSATCDLDPLSYLALPKPAVH